LGVTAAVTVGTALWYFATHSPEQDKKPEGSQTPEVSPNPDKIIALGVTPAPSRPQHAPPYREGDGDDPAISRPINLSKPFSIKYDTVRKRFEGVPDEIRQKIYSAGYTDEQVFNQPELIKDILDSFDYESVSYSNISHPVGVTHNLHITINEQGNIEGIPSEIRDAINKRGITDQQIIQDPSIVQDLVYSFNLEDVLKDHLPKISKPFGVTHDFSVTYDSKTGQVTGVPEAVVLAIKNAGHSLEEVIKNPHIIKDLLYSLDYEVIKESAKPQVSKPENCHRDFHITYDKTTGKITGIPEPIKQACIERGITEEEVLKNPSVVSDILYSFDYNEILKTQNT
jgi:stalled ribosome rescue protein Dom34